MTSEDCRLMDLYYRKHPSWESKAQKCDGQCEICIYYKKEKIRKYKCNLCGISHMRGEIFKDHFKLRKGHKQKRRGPYIKIKQ